MAEDRGIIREIAWLEVFPWLRLVRAVRLALSPMLLIYATAGLVLTGLSWRGLGWLFRKSEDQSVRNLVDSMPRWPWEGLTPAGVAVDPVDSPLFDVWSRLSEHFAKFFSPDSSLGLTGSVYLLMCGLAALAIWAFFGAAISRSAALTLARGDRLGLKPALGFACRKWTACFTAPLLPITAAVIVTIPVAIVGLLLRFDVGVFLFSLLWPFILLGAGLVLAVLLVGLFFGWPLMWPAVGAENSDSFDALSRSYSYTYQRPLRYFLYVVLAAALGLLGWWVVSLFADWVINLSVWAASWGGGREAIELLVPPPPDPLTNPPPEIGGTLGAGISLLAFWNTLVRVVAVGYVFSFFFVAATSIYFLLRYDVDGAEWDEVAVEEEAEAFGMPPLTDDGSGVPVPADSPLGENRGPG